MEKEIVCVYHKDCVDGTTAGAVVLKRFPRAQLFPLSHGHTPADVEHILAETNPSAHLYIVDSVLGLAEFSAYYTEITLLDHHISVRKETENFVAQHPQVTYIFDNEKSGASLTWSYLFSDAPLPDLIKHVTDDDIKTNLFGIDTDYVMYYLSPLRNDPEKICMLLQTDIDVIKKEGAYIRHYIQNEIERAVERPPIILSLGAYRVPFFNITDHQSACGNILSKQLGRTVCMYTISGDTVKCSFRSSDGQVPTALDVAEILGGGGHEKASGARLSLSDFVQNISAN